MKPRSSNPYDAPPIAAEPLVRQWMDLRGIWSEFRVGTAPDDHRIAVMIPHWPARGRVLIDDKEVHRFSMFQLRREINLLIDQPDPLQVDIRMRAGLSWHSQAFVNGELQIDEIFPIIRIMAMIFWSSVLLLVTLAAVAFVLERYLATTEGIPYFIPWVTP
ncbi:hypothetical protein Psta_3325 [Pirellula staleyi DSM 6068]|uniref:Uncharacterized protein n=1 Tax=Pirellula staleyi (strain ATCC 27377 / DSM 6068 / ICPB 4128) TaxID=530564 RepID=D2QXR2_PIRSD|nr:hypothetical protein [Pirellula staleyi]ADB17989.1 hypothetical protein Psta_3325 [Pirellula staleyi DSM 6068]